MHCSVLGKSSAVDVGAHIGGHTVGLAHAVGPSGRVYAYEAQSAMFDVLAANAQLVGTNNIEVLHTAVGGVCPGHQSTPPRVPVPRVDPRNRSSSVPHWRTITGLDRPGMLEAMEK
jgi:FkbM family methyltransferase